MNPAESMPGVKRKMMRSLAVSVMFITYAISPLFAESPHLKMGNPSGATADQSDKDNFLMEKDYFALSYNDSKGTPNWVSWQLTKDDLGNAPRKPFYPDKDLPAGFKQVTPKDYVGGGFDRGHMCPHSDRAADDDLSTATFVMTNIIPQSPYVNQKAWDQLEIYCRDLVENHRKTLYIISGPAGKGGTGRKGPKDTLADGKVTVPAKCWKVIMVLDAKRGNDLKKVNDTTRLIAVIMPNDMTVHYDWADFRVSVKDVEELTGYKFFDEVPSAIIDSLKEEVDDERISPPVIPRRGN
jgi:endonuclease G